MNWQNIIRRLTELGLFFLANPIYLLVMAGIITGLLLIGGIRSCNSQREEKKIANTQEKITVEKVEANSLVNQKENTRKEADHAKTNANQAVDNFGNILRRDSNQYQGADAGKRFCEKFPDDSTCR